jgi:PAS domain S-box-containing protein
MNTAQIIGYPLLLMSALELFLGFLLLKQNPRNSLASKATAACAFAAAIWSLSASLMYIRLSLGLDYLLFARASWVGWFTVPTALQTVFFLKDERSRKARLAGWVLYPFWTAVLALSLFTDLIVTPGFIPLPYSNSPGPLEMPLRLAGSMTAFWLIYEIVKLRRQVTGYRRAQLSYYLYGTVIFGTGGAVIGGFLQLFTGRGLEPSLSAFFSLPWVLMIFYAITRHRLFDIRFIISRTLIILILSFCISAFQFVLFKLLEPVIGPVATIFISVPVIGTIFFGTPLSRNVQQWINDLVLKGRYQYQKMLKESANAMVTILDRDELLRFIVETVRSGLGVREVFLYLHGPDGSYSVRHCHGANRDTSDGCVLPDNVATCLTETGQPLISDELAAAGPSGIDTGLRETIRRMAVELVLPLNVKGRLLGALTLNGRSNGEPYLQGDIDALQTLTSHAAVAIENTRLFEEAKKVKESLKQSEETFRALAQTLPAAVFIHQGKNFLYANPAAESVAGYRLEDYKTMEFWDIVHPDYRGLVKERAASRLSGDDTPQQYDLKIVRKNGEERWVLMSAGIVEYGGKPAVIGTIFDITDRKRAEEERARLFKENEKYYREKIAEQERFSAILRTTNDGFWIVNEENRIIYTNDAYCRMSGYTREEILSMTIADLEAQESPEVVELHTDNIRYKGQDRFETKHRRKDGSLIDLEVSVNRYKDEGIVFSFIRDITDRKKAEEEKASLNEENLRFYRERIAGQEHFAAVLSTTREGFWICGTDVRFTFVNDAYCRMLGYSREELLAMSIKDVEMNESADDVDARTERIKLNGYDLFETKHRRKDGSLIDLEITVSRFKDEHTFFSFGRDITDRKRAEAERARMFAEKEKILKDLHDGIGGITTNINLLAELAQKQEDLSAVKRSLATIAALSRDSLSEIRSFIQSLDAKELSWQAIAAEFRSLGNTIIVPHGIAFSFDTRFREEAGGPTSSVSMNLFRIYKESLANIIKHAKASSVDVSFSVEGGRVALEVRDNGIGLDGKRASGRGLVNMKNRALEMGGDLVVTTENGTRLRLEFPIP